MKITNEIAKKIKQGFFIDFDNCDFCEKTNSDEQMEGHIQFDKRFNLFAIFFNGVCVHTAKGIPSINRKLSLLEDKFNTVFDFKFQQQIVIK